MPGIKRIIKAFNKKNYPLTQGKESEQHNTV